MFHTSAMGLNNLARFSIIFATKACIAIFISYPSFALPIS
ncbi:hypothetical protein [Azospirillum largimobile]